MTLARAEVSPSRFAAKKAARTLIAALSWPKTTLGKLRHQNDRSVRALTYHRFGTAKRDPFCLPLDSFERQMAWLSHSGRAISPAEFASYLKGERKTSRRNVLVTIDDGDISVYLHAWPILRRYGILAIVFAIAGRVGHEGYMDWRALLELQAEGIEIGSHGVQHRSMAQLTAAAAEHEARASLIALREGLGRPIRAFAYPFGTWSDFSVATESVLQRAGYEFAFTSQHGTIQSAASSFTLPRIKIESGDSMWLFRNICSGGLDAYAFVDRHFYGLQQSHR